MPPQPRLGTPAPRTIREPDRERLRDVPWPFSVVPVPSLGGPADPDVALRDEHVHVDVLPRLVRVRIELTLEGGDRDVAPLRLAISQALSRAPALPLFHVRAWADDRQVQAQLLARDRRIEGPRPEPIDAEESWWELAVPVPAQGRVRLRVELVTPFAWRGTRAGALVDPSDPEADGYARVTAYDAGAANLYRARVPTRLTGQLHAPGRFELVPHAPTRAQGRRFEVRTEGRVWIEARLTRRELEGANRPLDDASAPGWLRLLHDVAFAHPDPAVAPDATGWLERIERLREAVRAGGEEGRLARGILRGLRARLRAEVVDPGERRVGWHGGEIDERAWAQEVERTLEWLTPPGEDAPPDTVADPDVQDGERFGRLAAPAFGQPNGLVLAHARMRRGETPLWIGTGALAIVIAAYFAWRRARRRPHAA